MSDETSGEAAGQALGRALGQASGGTWGADSIPERFSDAEREALFRIMRLRRDVRQFRPGEVDEATLARILGAAAWAPSVGFSQPWAFVLVRETATRTRIRESFLACRAAEAGRFSTERRAQYLGYRLEGILESALNVCVVADLRPRGEAILGSTVQPEAVRASVACAVQNLWLAARAEGVGVGWVSIVEPAVLRQALELPAGVEPIAYLCVGRPLEFRARPLLEETHWLERHPEGQAIHQERWRAPAEPGPARLGPAKPEQDLAPPAAERPTSDSAPPRAIAAFDVGAARASGAHQKLLTKPVGSLGTLERLAAFYAGCHGSFPPPPADRAAVAVFAADHGIAAEGVSAYGSQVTAGMVVNVMAGGAAVSRLAHRLGVEILLVDVGVAGDLSGAPLRPAIPLRRAAVRAGTANFLFGPAMSLAEAGAALEIGRRTAREAVEGGHQILAVGEIGIGNTTSAAAIVCACTGVDPEEVVGVGTGVDPAVRARKVAVVRKALVRHQLRPDDRLAILAAVGGLELGAMAGFLLEGARQRRPLILDGFLANAAALLAVGLEPAAADYLLAGHASAERGAQLALAALGKTAVLDLGLRLGEGTGALLALDLVRSAVDLQSTMATFATAGVVPPKVEAGSGPP